MGETIFHAGSIWTGAAELGVVEALAVRGGQILSAGPLIAAEALAPAAQKIDLGGRFVMPGFNDAHVHIWKLGHLLTSLADLREAVSIREIQELLAELNAGLPEGAWLLGRGWNEARLTEGRQLTRQDLDQVVDDRPAYLIRTCGHIAVANTRALELAGIDSHTIDPPGGSIGRAAGGLSNGLLREQALGLISRIVPRPGAADYAAMIHAAGRYLLSLGVTSATDPGVAPDVATVYRELERCGKLPLRMNVMALGLSDDGTEALPLPELQSSDFLRIDTVKYFSDGGLSGATAAMHAPYLNSDSKGILRLEQQRWHALALPAMQKGFRIAAHAIGDAAVDMVVSTYEGLSRHAALARPRIEHCGLPSSEALRRMHELDCGAVTQPIFLPELGVNFRNYLEEERLAHCYPFADMIKAGVHCAFSTDGPVVRDLNPLAGIQAAVLRLDSEGHALAEDQVINIEQALGAYTREGAWASADEKQRGILSPGKLADMVVLNESPLECEAEQLAQITVEQTYLGGTLVFERA